MKGFGIQKADSLSARDISVKGRIQGVGFRPFLYRLAKKHKITGWVKNCTQGVHIHGEGLKENLDLFIHGITADAPAAAKIQSIETYSAAREFYHDFSILPSEIGKSSSSVSEITPDIAVCGECLSDMHLQETRKNYLFTNCTNCGPRFSIIKALPYDRKNTTMEPFQMCNDCLEEYRNVSNRRFHAQPNSCHTCGPAYTFHSKHRETVTNSNSIIRILGEYLKRGGICAIKGLGGYHLACDPFNTKTVERLRILKKREGKPFAVMFSSIEEIRKYADVTEQEEKILTSPEAPIVLLKLHKKVSLSPAVYRELSSLGCFLPYTPFYHVLFSQTGLKALVLTSGNLSEEPLVTDDREALSLFLADTDGVVTYNRKIYNRCDDSVGQISGNIFRLIRRSRGWVPESLPLTDNAEGIFATGGELKNCFCIGKSNRAILSQHIGDLKNPETIEAYRNTVERFKDLFCFAPSLVVHDLHPDYASTRFAHTLGLPLLGVQHHHAHIASCLAENRRDETVIGFSYDGTGFGDDGNIWGGEVLLCSLETYTRAFHLQYMPLPGGDAAVREPWRMALSVLYQTYGRDFMNISIPFLRKLDPATIQMIVQMIDKKINTPLTSSMGRLFDAVSAILGLCEKTSFDAEAPMRLEAILKKNIKDSYPAILTETFDTVPVIKGITDDILKGISPGEISAKFHNTIIRMTVNAAERLRKDSGISVCALSGGVFVNAYLLEGCKNILKKKGFTVLTQSLVPANDGGLALGQIAIGAKKKEKGDIPCA